MKILIFILLSFGLSQKNIDIKEIKIYKSNEMNKIDFSEYITNMDGDFILKFIDIEDLNFNKVRKNVYEKCPLSFSISSPININDMKIKYCSSLFDNEKIDFYLDKDNAIIEIKSDKYDLLTGTFVFWLYGNFESNINTGDVNSIYNGVLREWNDNGGLYIEYNYKKEKKHGNQKRWYSNGQLEILYNFSKGKLDGEQKSWHNNGKIKSKIFYKNDLLHGVFKKWNSNGDLIMNKSYLNGILEKTFIDKS